MTDKIYCKVATNRFKSIRNTDFSVVCKVLTESYLS